MRQSEHLDLRELMQAIKAFRVLSLPCLFSKAVAECYHFPRQSIPPEHLMRVHAGQRDLCRTNQAFFILRLMAAARKMIHLAGRVPRLETASLDHRLARYIGSAHRSVALLCNQVHRPVAESHLKKSSLVLQEDKLVASDFRSADKVQQVELLADLEMAKLRSFS